VAIYLFIFYIFVNIGKIKNVFRKTKSSGIILAPWATFVSIPAFLLFLVFEVACGEEFACFFFAILAYFGRFFPNFATIKNFPKI